MKKLISTLIFVTPLLVVFLENVEAMQACPKVSPDGVQYSLTRPIPYISPEKDPYQAIFGIRRWLRPSPTAEEGDIKKTLTESENWFRTYSGYGVLGHGEDVFTSAGARFRKRHQGN